MRILVCSGLYPPHVMGGAERAAHSLALGLVTRGHQVRVLTAAPYEGASSLWGSVAREDGVVVDRFYAANVYFLPQFREHGTLERTVWQLLDVWSPHVWLKMCWLLRTWRPDLIHTHHLAGLSLAPIAAAAMESTPVVATVHDHSLFCVYGILRRPDGSPCPVPCRRCRLLTASKRRLTRKVDMVIGPSAYMLEEHRQRGFFPHATWHTLPNGIKTLHASDSCRSQRGRTPFHVVFIGQLAEYKGVNVLLEALKLLVGRDIRLSLAGDGPLFEHCRQDAAKDRRLHVLGRIGAEQRDALLKSADALILPSTCPESLGMVIGEAHLAGVPVIASRLGGMVEAVQDGQSGLLIEPGDARSLASAIERLQDDPILWARCAGGALEVAQRYNFDSWIAKTEAIYSDVLERPRWRIAQAR